MITDFCAVLLYLPTWDEWIEMFFYNLDHQDQGLYLPTWDEWIEIYIYNNNNKKEKYLPSWDEWIYKQDVGMHLAFLFSSLFSY